MFLSSRIRDADRSFLLKWGGSVWPNTLHLNSAAKRVIYYPCCASCSPRALFIERLCNFHPAEILFLNIRGTLQKHYRKIFMHALRRSHDSGLLTFVWNKLRFSWPPAHWWCTETSIIGLIIGMFLMNKSCVLDVLTHFCLFCIVTCILHRWKIVRLEQYSGFSTN